MIETLHEAFLLLRSSPSLGVPLPSVASVSTTILISPYTHTACKEAYSSSSPSEQYACLVGCNATTITSVFADTRTNTGSMMDSLQGMLHLMVMSSTDQDSSSQQDMDTLNQQAEILLPVSSSVSIVSKDVSVCHSGLFPSPLFLGLLPGFSVT